jgi:hypothetical protein
VCMCVCVCVGGGALCVFVVREQLFLFAKQLD